MDLISVIVPIYNVEPYLDRCIRSVADQTYTNLEIILVDDGSPDNCPAICDVWAQRDPRIRVIHKENGGLSDARNAGMAIATGELISFIDSDDSIEPEFLEKLFRALTEYDADIAECAVSYVDGEGNVLRRRETAPVQTMDKMEALRRLVQEDGVCQTVWNKLYRRHTVQDIPFAVGKYNEDEFWTWQVFDRAGKLAVVPECLYNYLQRDSSIIGEGYNIRRLDGIEAQFLRMQYLQKYEELAVLSRQALMMQCLWQYQCAARLLQGREKKYAQDRIRDVLRRTPAIGKNELTGKRSHRLWLRLFWRMPRVTAAVRNLLKIGM